MDKFSVFGVQCLEFGEWWDAGLAGHGLDLADVFAGAVVLLRNAGQRFVRMAEPMAQHHKLPGWSKNASALDAANAIFAVARRTAYDNVVLAGGAPDFVVGGVEPFGNLVHGDVGVRALQHDDVEWIYAVVFHKFSKSRRV